MINWKDKPEKEKKEFLERAREYIESGQYVGFDVEELAEILYEKSH